MRAPLRRSVRSRETVGHTHTACRSTRARRGSSLVETMVAMLLIGVGVSGTLGSAGAVARDMGGGMRQTVAASLAQARLDSLASLSCAQLSATVAGTATTRGVHEIWTVTDGRNTKTITVTLTLPTATRQPTYSTVIPCRD